MSKPRWRVWIAQVNQTYIDVEAESRDDAITKASRKWRRGWACAEVLDVRPLEQDAPEARRREREAMP